MNHLPQQVRDQIARATAIQDQLAAGAPTPPEPTPPEPAATPAAPAAEPSPAPAPEPTPPGDIAVNRKTGEAGDADYWKQRSLSLEGMLEGIKRRADERINQLVDQVTQLSAQVASAKPAAPAPQPSTSKEDEDLFGRELVDFTKRTAAQEIGLHVEEALKPLKAENELLKQQINVLGGRTEAVVAETFFDRLDKARPDWERINGTQEWLAWLGKSDPMTGYSRQALLDDAIAKQSLDRTLAMFEAFAGPYKPAGSPKQQQPDLSPAPRTLGTPNVPASRVDNDDTTPLVTRQQIAEHYKKCANGGYRATPDERKRMDDLITRAVTEGRVAA